LRLSITIDVSNRFATESSRGEPASIACAIRIAVDSFSKTAMIAEVSITISVVRRFDHSQGSRRRAAELVVCCELAAAVPLRLCGLWP
jgi:hypothetical protein